MAMRRNSFAFTLSAFCSSISLNENYGLSTVCDGVCGAQQIQLDYVQQTRTKFTVRIQELNVLQIRVQSLILFCSRGRWQNAFIRKPIGKCQKFRFSVFRCTFTAKTFSTFDKFRIAFKMTISTMSQFETNDLNGSRSGRFHFRHFEME